MMETPSISSHVDVQEDASKQNLVIFLVFVPALHPALMKTTHRTTINVGSVWNCDHYLFSQRPAADCVLIYSWRNVKWNTSMHADFLQTALPKLVFLVPLDLYIVHLTFNQPVNAWKNNPFYIGYLCLGGCQIRTLHFSVLKKRALWQLKPSTVSKSHTKAVVVVLGLVTAGAHVRLQRTVS